MAMANIAVRQEHHALELHHTQTPAIKSIVGFLKLALGGGTMSGICFRVQDVLYALDSLCRYHQPKPQTPNPKPQTPNRFRVHDVLHALDSLCMEAPLRSSVPNKLSFSSFLRACRCHERDLIGIECGLVDVAVEVTASWKLGQWTSTFSDAKASTHPVLELSTDILMHLAHR
jgi:hypothetical protein